LLITAVLGGLSAGVLGWLESGDQFDPRKFAGTIARSVISALVAFLGFQNVVEITVPMLVILFLAGMGVDFGGNTALKIINGDDEG
jgi:hypothetical protein